MSVANFFKSTITIHSIPPIITHKITTVSCVPPLLAKSQNRMELKLVFYLIFGISEQSCIRVFSSYLFNKSPNFHDFFQSSIRDSLLFETFFYSKAYGI